MAFIDYCDGSVFYVSYTVFLIISQYCVCMNGMIHCIHVSMACTSGLYVCSMYCITLISVVVSNSFGGFVLFAGVKFNGSVGSVGVVWWARARR